MPLDFAGGAETRLLLSSVKTGSGRMRRASQPRWVRVVLLSAAFLGSGSWSHAQFGRAFNQGEGDQIIEGVFLPPERTAKRRLDLAKELLEQKKYADSIRYLGALLEGAEDYFFKPDPTQPVYRSLKAEAGRMIGEMPSEGRESFELQFGATARRTLNEATSSHDINGLMEVSRRFFYTEAGAEATLLLGRHHFDHGRPLAAALCFQRLLDTPGAGDRFEPLLSLSLAACWIRAGNLDSAKTVLVQLKQRHPSATVQIAGKPIALFGGDAQALAWLENQIGEPPTERNLISDQWIMHRGDAQRNSSSHGAMPLLSHRWRVRTATQPEIEQTIDKLRKAYLSQDIISLPTMHPLAVGNVVLMRTTRGLLAIDFVTGKRIWEARPANDIALESFKQLNRTQAPFGPMTPSPVAALDQRMWDDATYGTMSSDGSKVFVIEDVDGEVGTTRTAVVNFAGQRVRGVERSSNRLAAFDLRTEGKLCWSIGGDSGEDEPKLAKAYFLGPPLPLLGKLYALAEMRGNEIRLVVLSAKTGELEWSQQLAVFDVNTNDYRRTSGATPSFADGVLVCPTSAGAIVAIDLTTRSLLWGYEYPKSMQLRMNGLQMLRAGMGVYGTGQRQQNDRWVDASLTIVDGKVLATPLEGDALHCLNLLDGKKLWQLERGSNIYVACVHNGKVVLVGHRQVSAFNLDDGKAAWEKAIELPSGGLPSGRGFFSGDYYYLPLSSAEVAKINLKTGVIEQRARSRHGNVPGNLVCFKGEVVSQNVDYLETYYQLDTLKQTVAEILKQRPDDSRALARSGEIELNEGRLARAIEHFRRSYQLDEDESSRDLLVESMLEALKVDFKANRNLLAELEKLIATELQQARFSRVLAVGLQQAGETLPAFEAFVKLADSKLEPPKADEPNLESIDESLLTRRDRWVKAQLSSLYNAATPEDRVKIDEMVQSRLKAALASGGALNLRQFLQHFGLHPLAEEAREQLALKLTGSDHLLEKEMLLSQLRNSTVPERARAATARLAALLVESRQPESAALIYRELEEKWPNQICLDGKTGKQIVADLPADSPVRKPMAGFKPWPTGNVTSRDDGNAAKRTLVPSRLQRAYGLAIRGNTGPFFNDMIVTLDQGQQGISGQDGLGTERFRVQLAEGATRRTVIYQGFNTPMLNYTSVNNHLLVLCMGHQLMAIDTLRGREMTSNRVLWTQELLEHLPGMPTNQGIHPRTVNVGWGVPRILPADTYGRPIGSMGPVNYNGVCFQRFRDLVCVDPLSGEVQWTRKNIQQGCDIFGDEELLFVVPSDGGDALVVRAMDGELLGKRRIPMVDQRMVTIGRKVVQWRVESNRPSVVMFDPWTNTDLWRHRFEPGAKASIVGEQAIGVLEGNGQFTIIDLATGKLLTQQKLELNLAALLHIYMLKSRDQYILVTNVTPSRVEPGVTIQAAPGGLDNPLVSGQVLAFDRVTGKRLWETPVSINQQGLMLSQPVDVPVLAFARHKYSNPQAGQHHTELSVMCLDKRTGRVVYKNDKLKLVINNLELAGDPAERTVSMMFPGKTITLTLSDDPIPAEAADDGSASAPRKGLIEAFGNILKTIGDSPNDKKEPGKSEEKGEPSGTPKGEAKKE